MTNILSDGKHFGLIAITSLLLGTSGTALAVAPDAVNDDLSSDPVTAGVNKEYDESDLTANDLGDGKTISLVNPASTKGILISWSNPQNTITYNASLSSTFDYLDSGDSTTDTFGYTLSGTDGDPDSATVTLQINGVNDSPTLSDLGATQNVNDNATVTPFTGVTITDPDDGETLTVTVTISTASEGSFTTLGGFVDQGNGSYEFSGTASAAQTALRGLVFDPTENTITPGDSDNATLTVKVDDGDDSVSDSVAIKVTSINDTPAITLPGSNPTTDDDETTKIFSGVSLTDPDYQEQLDIVITYDESKGDFTAASLSSTGFSDAGSGKITKTASGSQTVATAQTALRNLEYEPIPNLEPVGDTYNLTFNIDVEDKKNASDNEDLTVVVTSVNDAPELDNAGVSSFSLSGGESSFIYDQVTVTDADVQAAGSGDGDGDDFTATIVLSGGDTPGVISSNEFILSQTEDDTYTFTGILSEVQQAIQAVTYLAPSSNGTYSAVLTVEDSNNGTSNPGITITLTVTTPTPGMTGLVAGQQVADNGVILPFATAIFNSFGSINRLVEIRLDNDAKGTFDILAGFTKETDTGAGDYVYTFEGTSSTATTALQTLRFKPTANRIVGSSENVIFTIKVLLLDGSAELSSDSLTLTVVPVNNAPTISSDSPEIRIDDDETATPFATVSVADVDEGGDEELTVTISLIGEDPDTGLPLAGGGVLSSDDEDFVRIGSTDVYEITGTADEVNAILQTLVFTPTANRNEEGQRETVTFTLEVEDGNGGYAQNSNTTVIVLSVNGAPSIIGVPSAGQQPYPIAGSVNASGDVEAFPFANLEVVDDDDSLDFVITLDNPAKGTLSTDDFTTSDGGTTYTMSGTDAEVTAALNALKYTLDPDYPFSLSAPGQTQFTLQATDTSPAENSTTKVFEIVIREQSIAHIVTSAADNTPGADPIAGSLREAIELAGNNDFIVFDFKVDDYPVTIRLNSTLVVNKNITIVGPGVDLLTISGDTAADGVGELDADGIGEVALFYVEPEAQFAIEQVTLADGYAPSYGGAISADEDSRLEVRYCHFLNNTADQYGGAIDMFLGELIVEGCLFEGNQVASATAVAGGAISVYTTYDSSIINCTFSENLQAGTGAFGGAAIYAENADLSDFFFLQVEHCTFYNNEDTMLSGSAILAASTGMVVVVRNNIFADEQGLVLDVLGGGAFESLGGNIATDATLTTYTQGGVAQNITLLGQPTDQVSTDPLLLPLADNGGATFTHALDAASPAIDNARPVTPVEEQIAIDQRGVWRDNDPDIGAFEADNFKRVNINEIFVQGAEDEDFIEFYNPRESASLDMDGLELWVDGALAQTFGTQVLAPGAGFAWTSTVDLNAERGTLELRNTDGQSVLWVDYVAGFAESGTELDITDQSITRYPRYEGAFLPHKRVVERVTGITTGDDTSPGDDVDGSELGGGNAPPIAVSDETEGFSVLANEIFEPGVMLNDIEFDRTDTIKVTEIMDLDAGEVISQELFAIDGSGVITLEDLPVSPDTTVDPTGVVVSILPDGAGISYDPTASDTMIGLSEGETITDIWAYTILDYDDTDTAQSRGADDTTKEDNIIKATTFFTVTVTGVNEAPDAMDDSFSTAENQAVRILADATLLSPAVFSFGDQDADFGDFDASGNPVVLKPAAPTLALLDNDDDVDSDDTNATILLSAVHTTEVPTDLLVTTSALGASVVLDLRANRAETNILYDPRGSAILNSLSQGETTEDSFYYSVVDQHGARSIAKVTVTVTGVNDVPTATDDDGYEVTEDLLLEIEGAELLANDTDPDTNGVNEEDMPVILQPIPASSTLGATLSFDGTTLSYDPRSIENFQSLARNESIIDTFTYTTDDENGGTDEATVTVLVYGLNDAPVAANDLLEILENDTTVVLAADGLLANDTEVDINGTPPDDDPWVIPQRDLVTPMGAELNINTDGSYRYDANSAAIDSLIEGELAVETFPYVVIDNSRTVASDDSFRVWAHSESVLLPVLANDAALGTGPVEIVAYQEDEADPDVLIIESDNHALRSGLLVLVSGYEGTGDYNGVYPVSVIDRDHFSIPVAYSDDPEGTRGTWQPWFNITAATDPDQGGVLVSPDGQYFLYTPTEGFYGTESFSYTIEDGVGGQDVATVNVKVVMAQLNELVSASDDQFRIGMDTTAIEVDVLANDNILPATGSALSILEVSPIDTAAGLLEIINEGTALVYTPPAADFTGEESFSYVVSGGGANTAEAVVTFIVEDRTGQLSGNDDSFFVITGSSANLLDVLANDPDLPAYPVSSSLSALSATSSGGIVAIEGDSVAYTPPASPFLGTDSFTYTAKDASGATTTQTVQVTVVADVANFHASADHYRVVAGSGQQVLPVLLNDGTVQNPTATLSIVNLGLDTDAPPNVSRVAIGAGQNTILYTPPSSPTVEEFNYEISIGTIDRREATITVTVVDSFDMVPAPVDDNYHVAKDSPAVELDVLLNDLPYPDAGWSWTIASATVPDQGGTVEVVDGTSLSYTPLEGFFGTETFEYTIEDSFGDSATATVTVYVGSMLTKPDAFTVLEDSTGNSLNVLLNDDLLEQDAEDYTILSVSTPDQGGSASVDGSGPYNSLLYAPAPGFVGEEVFTYTIVDQTGGTLEETVTVLVVATEADRDTADLRVEITGVNDIPVISGTSDKATTDKLPVSPFAGVTVTDLDAWGAQIQTVTVSYDATYGSLTAPGMSMTGVGQYQIVDTPAAVSAALQAIVFTPYENFIDYIDPGQEDVDFTLSVDDGYVASPIVDVTTVTVTPINDAPTLTGSIADLLLQVNSFDRGFQLAPLFADVDDDIAAGELVWTVVGNTDPSLFDSVQIDSDKQMLILSFAANQFGVSEITIRGTDRGGLYVETSFTVTVEGPPVIVLEDGEVGDPTATLLNPNSTLFYNYRMSFRVENQGTLPAEAFIVRMTDPPGSTPSWELTFAEYSTNENGTPGNFQDDTRSSNNVTVKQLGTESYRIRFNLPLASGESEVVHLTYRLTVRNDSFAPDVAIELTTAAGTSGIMEIEPVGDGSGNIMITFSVEAGRSYRLEYSNDMVTWLPWAESIPVSSFDRTYTVIDDGSSTDSPPSEVDNRFYRLVDITP
ncbi:Ig-like domain-containing protein [Coraliomargarita parva]|uniref:Ig-like domain-containing protein n=1 Tax=Coraliomargarita parva TaxID=3014050 RepID=UPI0022B4B928|nr:Ig-like domain-containing protein [Coraliomargarita parva]